MADSNASDDKIPRRNFLLGAGTAVAATLAPTAPSEAQTAQAKPAAPPAAEPEPLLTLTATEHAFFVAAADAMIPADELSPSGGECGVATSVSSPAPTAAARGSTATARSPRPSP